MKKMILITGMCVALAGCHTGSVSRQKTPFDDSAELRQIYLDGYEMGYTTASKGEKITCPHGMAPPDKQAPLVQGFYAGQYDGLTEFEKKKEGK